MRGGFVLRNIASIVFLICRGADDAASAAGGGGGGGGGGSMVRPRDNECGRADRETKRPKHV